MNLPLTANGFRFLLILMLSSLSFKGGNAQSGFQFAHIDFTQGLSNNQVNAIYKDTRGFMWLGTMSGLNRYDGYQFKIFRHNLSDTTSLNDNYISRICEDPFKKLWIQTREGFNIYDPDTEKFNRNPAGYLKSLSLPVNGFSDVIQTRNGFWAKTAPIKRVEVPMTTSALREITCLVPLVAG